MERAAVSVSAAPSVLFQDGLGERRHITDPAGNETLEVLCFRGELATVPSFEFALRERVSRLASFRHSSYGRVKSVERLNDPDATLAIVSELVPGLRLSELLANADRREIPLDINSALGLIRQLVAAMAALHENARDTAHGALGPERVVMTPQGRLVIVEYVIGSALEQLRFSHERYWNELRVPLPRAAGLPRFDQRADVMQLGMLGLSLILGRPLKEEEFPSRIAEVLASTWAVSARGGFEPLPSGLRAWLGRALQLDSRNAFGSAIDAGAELEKVLGDTDSTSSPANLDAFLAKLEMPAFAKASARQAPTVVEPSARQGPAAPVASARQAPAVVDAPIRPTPMLVEPPRPAPFTIDPPRPAAIQPNSLKPVAAALPKLTQPVIAEPEPEPEIYTPKRQAPRAPLRLVIVGGALVAIAAVVAGGMFAARRYSGSTPASTTGTLVVTTNPSGVQTFVDGQVKGLTPLTLTLPAGSHMVELRGEGEPRSIPVSISAGREVSQYIELPRNGPSSGKLQVRTEPAGAQVSIDGVPRGTSPTLVPDLPPGEHVVVLTSDFGSVRQTVTIESGVTASLVVPLSVASGAPVSGWVSVSSPIDVQLYERDQLLGTSQTDRIMVAVGRHDLDLVNETLGFRASRTVQVGPGKTASFKVDVPTGVIALNAVPWAEVWIDGEKVGETPIGNLPVSIGSHDIVFRHPDLGEQHHTATVTLKQPTRLSIDLRKK